MASLTKYDLVAALEELLPPLDPTAVKFSTIMEDLARHLGVDKKALKANHKDDLKEIIADMLHLCQGGENKENDPENDEDEEEEEEEHLAKKTMAKRARGRRIVESEDEENVSSDGEEEDASGGSESDEEERQPKRRKKVTPATKKVPAQRKTPIPRKPVDKANESEGMTALKELARVAGVLSPAVYAILKKLESEDEQEAVLRERLQDAGVRFSSRYPKKGDIAAAKRKREKEKELDGIDTSLIITGGRPRRGATQQVSYVSTYDDEDGGEGDEHEKNDGDEEELHDRNEDESDAHDEGSEASDDSEAEF